MSMIVVGLPATTATAASPIAPYGAIGAEWNARGGAVGFLGAAQDNEYNVTGVSGARMEDFQGGQIYWSGPTGAHEVHGLIAIKYRTTAGGPTEFGLPLTDEVTTPDGVGRFNHFQGNRSIYWTPSTGAHTLYAGIRGDWAANGWEQGVLGYPTSDENNALAPGRYNDFQHGVIYWSPAPGAHEVHGAILAAWAALGYERSALGFPTTDERDVFGGGGRESYFEGGYINWVNHEITVHVDQHN